jgi:hypothetical protein
MSKILKNSFSNSTARELVAFVGLNESIIQNNFLTSSEEPLECFDYRAWALGNPPEIRKRPSCVVLTAEASWKIKPCNNRLPYICEISTGGPNPYIMNINENCTTLKPNNRFKPRKI